jgi:beta propeller repeat protein
MTQAHVLTLSRRAAVAGAAILLFLLVLALALPALARADVPSSIVESTSMLWKPDVSDQLIVWEDQDYNGDIWAKGSGAAFRVSPNTWAYAVAPAVDGTVVVWQDDRLGSNKIYGANVDPSAGTVSEFAIATNSGVKTDPDISGRYVVWVDTRAGNQDIYGYDLLTQTEFVICNNTAKQEAPAISGTLVVWRDFRHNSTQGDIYAARLSTTSYSVTEFPVRAQTSGANYVEAQPAVAGATVTWVDQRVSPGNYRVYAATVAGAAVVEGSEWQVSQTVTRGVSNPTVNGTLIAWTYTGGTTSDDIYARRTDQTAEFAVASTTKTESWASVGRSRTAWADRTNWDIYAADLGGFGWSAGIDIDGGAAHAMTRNVTLGLSAWSSVSLATQMAFSNDNATWTDWYTYATTFSWVLPGGDGTKTVYAKFKDADGNVSPVKSDTIVLDEFAPVTDDDAPEGWATGDVTVTLTADDHGGSGVTGTVYDLNGVGNVTYQGPITISGDGLHTLVYRSADAVSRAEEPKVVQIWIDGTAPVTTDDAGTGWHPAGWTLQLDPYDAVQLESTEFSVNGGPWQPGNAVALAVARKRAGGASVYQVRYRSVDAAGNVEAIKECSVKLDARAPVTTTDYDGMPSMTDLTVNLFGYDEHSGVAETWYSVDGADPAQGASVVVPGPADGTNDGQHVITYYSVDNVGNVETVRWVVVTIAAGTP